MDDEVLVKILYIGEYLKKDDIAGWKRIGQGQSLEKYLVDYLRISPNVIKATEKAYEKEPFLREFINKAERSKEDLARFTSLLNSYIEKSRTSFWDKLRGFRK